MRTWVFAVALWSLGCGAATSDGATQQAQIPSLAPSSRYDRERALQQFAQRVFQTLQSQPPVELVFDDLALRRLLNSVSATRASALRHAMAPNDGVVPAQFELLRTARFTGACFQGLREEPPGTVLGLLRAGWVFERMLLVGEEPTGPVALWVEGEFLWTDAGFGALSIQHVETPRRGHADLELAVCDVDLGVRRPLDIVVSDTINH